MLTRTGGGAERTTAEERAARTTPKPVGRRCPRAGFNRAQPGNVNSSTPVVTSDQLVPVVERVKRSPPSVLT